MKKYLVILFSISLLFTFTVAYAELDTEPIACLTDVSITPYSTQYVTRSQSCYVHVKVVHEQPDGSTVESIISPVAFTITYRIQLTKDSQLGYIGASLVPGDGYPSFSITNSSVYNLGVSVQNVTYPTNISLQGGDTYTVTVSGGRFNVTYNSVIYVNASGVQTSAVSATEPRTYYITITGP